MSWVSTPRNPRVTLPRSISWDRIDFSVLIGIAKLKPWVRSRTSVLIPTILPWALRSGPPELPGLIAASVCRKSSNCPPNPVRPFALTIPSVTV